jgi:2'-5' RNA ligase
VNAARAAYAANWQLTKRWLRRAGGQSTRVRELAEIGQPHLLTTVVRLPAELAEPLAEAAAPLRCAQPEHYVYPADSIHLTILALGDAAGAEDEIRSIADRRRPFAVDVHGLNVSRSTVFAELYPRGSGLESLRRELHRALATPQAPPLRWLRQRLAHANIVRFAAPVDRRLIAEVAKLRARCFGRFEVTEIELVRADKVLSSGGTRVLRRFPLRGSGGSAHPG